MEEIAAERKLLQSKYSELGEKSWCFHTVSNILQNEKYCGDVLMQKTFISDCISKKAVRNTGQLPKYLIQNHHPAIVERRTFNAVQAELAKRKAAKSPTKAASTGLTSYASKYTLSERLVCGECGTLYRRCTWRKNSKTRIVWVGLWNGLLVGLINAVGFGKTASESFRLLRACLKSFDKSVREADNREKQAGVGGNASISK